MGDDEYATCLCSNSKAVDISRVEYLLCNEIIESDAGDFSTQVNLDSSLQDRDANASCGIGDLLNIELDTPPDFQVTESPLSTFILFHTSLATSHFCSLAQNLQFDSQDSVFDSLDRL